MSRPPYVSRVESETQTLINLFSSRLEKDVFGGVIGEYFVFSAVDTPKGKDAPSGLSGLHRKTPDGGARQRRPRLHYTLTHESGKRSLVAI